MAQLENDIKQVKPFRNEYHRATVNLIYSGKWMIQFISDMLEKHNLTNQQYNILRILRGKYPGAITVKLIRERMLDRMSDASRIVENLRKKNLVERNTSNTDRRQMDVIISKKGMELLMEIDKENDFMDNHLSALNEKEIKQLNKLLDKLRN